VVRIDTDVVLPSDVTPERARGLLLSAVRGADGVLTEPPPFVVVGVFNESGVAYSVRFFIEDFGRRDPIESGVRQRVFYAVGRAGIEFRVPHRHLHVVGLDAAHAPRAAGKPESLPLAERLARVELFKTLDAAALARLAAHVHAVLYA